MRFLEAYVCTYTDFWKACVCEKRKVGIYANFWEAHAYQKWKFSTYLSIVHEKWEMMVMTLNFWFLFFGRFCLKTNPKILLAGWTFLLVRCYFEIEIAFSKLSGTKPPLKNIAFNSNQ